MSIHAKHILYSGFGLLLMNISPAVFAETVYKSSANVFYMMPSSSINEKNNEPIRQESSNQGIPSSQELKRVSDRLNNFGGSSSPVDNRTESTVEISTNARLKTKNEKEVEEVQPKEAKLDAPKNGVKSDTNARPKTKDEKEVEEVQPKEAKLDAPKNGVKSDTNARPKTKDEKEVEEVQPKEAKLDAPKNGVKSEITPLTHTQPSGNTTSADAESLSAEIKQ